jgi:hypothetical protein
LKVTTSGVWLAAIICCKASKMNLHALEHLKYTLRSIDVANPCERRQKAIECDPIWFHSVQLLHILHDPIRITRL